ncbi:MAG TPA: LysR family transcriptional regulator, partial [Polyangiaceae bacterium]
AVDAGSLSAGARRLGMPLATVSRKVSELEQHLKTRLLNRSGRQLTLTDAGQSYVASCKRILEQLGEADRAAMGEYSSPRGELTITAPLVFGRTHALPVVTEFLEAYPEIDVRLVLSDRVANLFDEHFDVAIRVGDLPDSSLVATCIGGIHRVVCASPGYLSAHGTPLKPRDLERHYCVTFEGLTSPQIWIFRSAKGDLSVAVHSRLAVNTAEAAIDAAAAGLGITRVLSYQVAAAERTGNLVRLLCSFESPATPVNLVYDGQPLRPLKLRAFIDFAVPRLKARLSEVMGGQMPSPATVSSADAHALTMNASEGV